MSHEALEAIFVQREPLIARLVALTRDSILTPTKHYTLLIGPRGIGKTHLIALLYHRLCAMPELHERMRLAWLREEEWGVTSFLDFLLRVFTALLAEYQDPDLAVQVEALYTLPPAQAQQQAESLLRAYCAQRTLVLLMENLDELFNECGEACQQRLRAYLQEHPFCTMVATAQSLFSGVSRQKSPFYGFFRLSHLEELRLDEAVQLLTRLAEYAQQPALAAVLQQPRGRARVQAIAHLAGGNHRVYVILAQFLTQASLEELVEPFLSMLDDLTPYYQARMAWLSPQQRKLVYFLCAQRGALPVKDIAQHCFMSQQTAASRLQKLQHMGYVHSTAMGRESFYELREPLMRMGMDVKKQRGQPVRLFVEFLRYWYQPGELEARLELLQPHAMLDQEYLQAALAYSRLTVVLEKQADEVLSEESRHEDAIAVYDEVVARFNSAADPSLQIQIAAALHNKGYRLGVLGRGHDAIAVYDQVVTNFGAAHEPTLQEQVAKALANKGAALAQRGDYDHALKAYDTALAHHPTNTTAAVASYLRVSTLFVLQHWEHALQALDDALGRFPQDHDRSDPTPIDTALRLLLNSTAARLWSERIHALYTCYGQHEALSALGQGLVRSIAVLYSPMVSQTAAQTWYDLWQQHGQHAEALMIPLRLLDAAVRYRTTHDQRMLLHLPMEERAVLEQVLAACAPQASG
jgi:tetratricopeptide (TPR) repeat protein